MFKVADRVKEQSVTTGLGTYDLDGAVLGHRTFVAGVGDGNQCYYTATNGTDWEVGIGTVTNSSPDTLSRDTIYKSSNADAAVNWSAGIKNLFITPPATYYAGQGKLYINNVSNAANTTSSTAGVDIRLPLNGDGTNNFTSSTITTGKCEFDATYDSNDGGIIVDQINPDSELTFRFTFVNVDTGSDTVIAKVFLVFNKADPDTGVLISSTPLASAQDTEHAVELSGFHGGIEAVYPVINSASGKDYQLNGFKVVAHEISAEE